MLTVCIITIAILIIGSIIVGIVQSDNSDFIGLHIIAIISVITLTSLGVAEINKKYNTIKSNEAIKPSMRIEVIQNDSIVIKSDTTYIYKFRKNN